MYLRIFTRVHIYHPYKAMLFKYTFFKREKKKERQKRMLLQELRGALLLLLLALRQLWLSRCSRHCKWCWKRQGLQWEVHGQNAKQFNGALEIRNYKQSPLWWSGTKANHWKMSSISYYLQHFQTSRFDHHYQYCHHQCHHHLFHHLHHKCHHNHNVCHISKPLGCI